MKPGKVVILGGNARSGKSTLANKLTKYGFAKISFDDIYNIVKNTFNIDLNESSKEVKFKLFESIVDYYVAETSINGINVVIDMYDYLPEEVVNLKNIDKVTVYYLAYPSCTKSEIRENLKKYSKPTDWIVQVNENYFEKCVERFYLRNRILVKQCKKYDAILIDTKGGEDRPKVLEKLFDEIIKLL